MKRRTWRPERAIGIADAIDDLLSSIDDEVEHPPVTVSNVLLPYSSGVVAIDKVCGGGLAPATVTVLDCPLQAQSRSLLYSSARATDVPTLLAVADLVEGTRWLIAGAADVPAGLIRAEHLAAGDWDAISATVEALAHRQLALTQAESVMGIGHLIEQHDPSIVIVEEPDRFGPAGEVIDSFVHLARSKRVAILTAVSSFPPLSDITRRDAIQVTVVPKALASRAALLTTDCGDGLAAAEVEIATLAGRATDIAG